MLPAIFYGCVAAGSIYSSVPSSCIVPELCRFIKLAPSDFVICSSDTKEVAVKTARACGISPERVLQIDVERLELIECTGSGENVLGKEEMEWERLTTREAAETSPVCLIYSSGTTGLPKGKRAYIFLFFSSIRYTWPN